MNQAELDRLAAAARLSALVAAYCTPISSIAPNESGGARPPRRRTHCSQRLLQLIALQ